MNTIFYLREIGAGLNSGMTLQVLNDYGHLSRRGYVVQIPAAYRNDEEWKTFSSFITQNSFDNLRVIGYPRGSGIWRFNSLRRISFMFNAQRHMRRAGGILVIREQKHMPVACALRRITAARIVSEMHEGCFGFDASGKSRMRYQKFLDGLDGVLFTNSSQIVYLEENGFTIPDRHIVLPNGIDYSRYSSAAPPADGTDVVLTYAGQFTSWKNLPLLFAALRRLGPRYRLRVAGGKGDEGSASYISGLAKKHNVDGRIDYLGFVHPDELISRVISGSSVLVVPLGDNTTARYATSPMKLVEYMATSIPVVAVGHPSVVGIAGHDSVHLSGTDPDRFADAVRAAVEEDSDTRKRRIDRTKALAARFDHEVRARRFDAWLRRVVL